MEFLRELIKLMENATTPDLVGKNIFNIDLNEINVDEIYGKHVGNAVLSFNLQTSYGLVPVKMSVNFDGSDPYNLDYYINDLHVDNYAQDGDEEILINPHNDSIKNEIRKYISGDDFFRKILDK